MGDLVDDIETIVIDIIQLHSRVIVLVLPAFILESLAIVFGSH
jgi:hypothetical protein